MKREAILEKFREAFQALAFYEYESGIISYSERKELLIEVLKRELGRDEMLAEAIRVINDDEYITSNWG